MIRLATNKFKAWAVYCPTGFFQFETIEQASDYLVDKLKVNDNDVDDALIEMTALNKRVAIFNEQGRFERTADY